MLPATKSMPKELLPIVDKPSIQYIVEEAVAAGIEDIFIITSRAKVAMEDHFDYSPEVERKLLASGNEATAQMLRDISDMANIRFVRQKEQKGLGHAVYCVKNMIGDGQFAVLLGDDLMRSNVPVIGQLISDAERFSCSVVGVKEVSEEAVQKYCTLEIVPVEERLFEVKSMIEKPKKEQIMSLYSILGRYVLPSEIFTILETLPTGHGGEIQLTDALGILCKKEKMLARDFLGKRYDCGNPAGYLEAVLDFAKEHPLTASMLREYVKNFAE